MQDEVLCQTHGGHISEIRGSQLVDSIVRFVFTYTVAEETKPVLK